MKFKDFTVESPLALVGLIHNNILLLELFVFCYSINLQENIYINAQQLNTVTGTNKTSYSFIIVLHLNNINYIFKHSKYPDLELRYVTN